VIAVATRVLLATFGFDERRVLPSLRLLAYDRLVLLAGRDSLKAPGFERLRSLEPDVRTVTVDPFDLHACLDAAASILREAERLGHSIRVSVSGGTKILAAAALLAAFHAGVEAWYCDPDPVRLPVLRGVRIVDGLSAPARDVADFLRGATTLDRLVARVSHCGLDGRTTRAAVRELVAHGLAEQRLDGGKPVVRPTRTLAAYRRHFPRPGKA
jgi:hypothetical protein